MPGLSRRCADARASGNGTQNIRDVTFTSALQLLTLVCGCAAGSGEAGVSVRVKCAHACLELVGRGVSASPPNRATPRDDDGGDGDDSMLDLLWRTAFSEDEWAILRALADGPLTAAGISKKLHEKSEEPSTRLKILLANLCDRGVLTLPRGEPYTIADARLLEVVRAEGPHAEQG